MAAGEVWKTVKAGARFAFGAGPMMALGYILAALLAASRVLAFIIGADWAWLYTELLWTYTPMAFMLVSLRLLTLWRRLQAQVHQATRKAMEATAQAAMERLAANDARARLAAARRAGRWPPTNS